jgi:hypothetical protein
MNRKNSLYVAAGKGELSTEDLASGCLAGIYFRLRGRCQNREALHRKMFTTTYRGFAHGQVKRGQHEVWIQLID